MANWRNCVTLQQDTFKDTDDSSETSYFTPELELSVENSQEKHLSDESNKSRGEDTPEQSSSDHSGSSILTTEERNQTVCYARNRTFEKDTPRVTTFSSSPDSRSIIDVEGISTILLDLKSPAKDFTPPKSIEASARHSTPVNQATCSKIRPLQKEKSLETSCWASLESYKSTKSSVTFLSREYDVNSVNQLQEKVTDVQEPFIKNQGLVCIVGSLENSEGNNLLSKTDCECQSMDITSLSNENEKTNHCDTSDCKKKSFKDIIANTTRQDAAE
ncbi:uncharacterized protein [Aquarana catesbeiana]|uniref:uncharacterized protein isoform X2 n=1 Tax=Aquarana catesbeiana TaxID=8400 RepID=UPI003CC9324C